MRHIVKQLATAFLDVFELDFATLETSTIYFSLSFQVEEDGLRACTIRSSGVKGWK